MSTALLNQDGNKIALTFNCPTGNCAFEPFKTVAFCSACKDISANITSTCNGTCNASDAASEQFAQSNCSAPFLPDGYGTGSDSDFTTGCNYTLRPSHDLDGMDNPLQLSLSQRFSYTFKQSWQPYRYYGENMSTATSFNNYNRSVGDPWLTFARAIHNNRSASSPGWNTMVPNVTRCALSICVQTLNTTIRNGILQQKILSSWQSDFMQDQPRTDSFRRILKQSLQSTTYVESRDFNASKSTPVFDSDIGPTLWSTSDLNRFMDPFAARLSDWLRMQSTEMPATGRAYRMEVHVAVNWLWLILPVTLVLLSCILLLITIISSKQQHTQIWKSNSLATLFHGLSGSGDEGPPLTFPRHMERAAEQIYVRLTNDGGRKLHLVASQHIEPEKSRSGLRGFIGFPGWRSKKRQRHESSAE